MVNVLGSSSRGNAVMYFDNRVMVDCGVGYERIKEFQQKLSLVLLTHCHQDHFSFRTLQLIQSVRPSVRIGCPVWLAEMCEGLQNVDVYEVGKLYDYGTLQVSPVKLYHDVQNCGYRIFRDGKKVFHATDTAHLEGITAKGYDLYALEANYDEDKAAEAIRRANEKGEYCYAIGSVNSHLSWQQAMDFFHKNRGEHSQMVELHKSEHFY